MMFDPLGPSLSVLANKPVWILALSRFAVVCPKIPNFHPRLIDRRFLRAAKRPRLDTAMTQYLASSLTYSIVPPLLTSYLQKLVYSSNIIPAQHPQSPKFHRDRLIIYTLVVVAYLVYTTYTAYTGLGWTYYNVLGVSTSVTPSELRSRFKSLSVLGFRRNWLKVKSITSR